MNTLSVLPAAGLLLLATCLISCTASPQNAQYETAGTALEASTTATADSTAATADSTAATATGTPTATATAPVVLAEIIVDAAAAGTPINPYVLGSNVPAWLNPSRLADGQFQTRGTAAGLTIVRIPGGSWSNYYDWLACERDGQGIDADAVCYWPWAARPSDFLAYLRDTGMEGMYTVNMNGTAKEAAALVAFFNGSLTDDTPIGVDVRGRDWGKVSDWAQLRADHGNPEPLQITYWEIGNEIYGGKEGKDCAPWGWEDVWTCDGTEYVTGIGSGTDRREGFLAFREAMRAVDPAIKVGAVGIAKQGNWSNWGNEVISAAGDSMDFYVIHHYGYNDPPSSYTEVLALPQQTWGQIMPDVLAAFDQHAGGREVPVAITEYNLFSAQEGDTGDWMSRAVNGLYLADNIGQMMLQGVSMANQWDIAHGEGAAKPGYGLVQADTYFRSPQYYALVLWSRFGTEMLPVVNPLPADRTLSVYSGRIDEDMISLLAINKTAEALQASIQFENVEGLKAGVMDVLTADSLDTLTAEFNGNPDPADDFSDALSYSVENPANPLLLTFEPYSITLLRLDLAAGDMTATPTPTETPVITPEAPIMLPIITAERDSDNET